jgi:ABC-type transport system substrate-binding protein
VDASGEKLPYLDGIDFDIIRDSFTAFAAFRTGRYLQADFLDPGLLNNNIEQVKREFPDWTYGVGYGSWREYVFRNKAPFNDVRIRRALDMLIDRPAFVQVTAPGYGTHVASPLLPPELGGAYGLSAAEAGRLINIGPVTPERLAEAKKLFADAGVKFDGFTFEILSLGLTQYDNDTLVLVDQWKRAGLKPVFNNKPGPPGYGPKRIAGDFDLYYVPASSFGDDPDFVLGPFYPTGAGQNYGRWSDPKLDKLYSDQQREVDSAKRKQIAQDLQRYILTDAVWHPKVAWSGAWTAVSPRMRNHTALCPGAYCYRARVEDVWIAPEPAR